jgi:tetratricopeptide (TPR) repeat protein
MANLTGVKLRDVSAQTITISGIEVRGATVEELVEALEAKGLVQSAELAGLQRRTVVKLAQRFEPEVLNDFTQAVDELERAVEIALGVIAKGEQGADEDAFVNTVLARVAERVRADDLDGAAGAIDEALAELDAEHRRRKLILLVEGVKADTLRRDAVAAARRLELIVDIEDPSDRPPWSPAFRARWDTAWTDGKEKGVNFSLAVAIALARRMLETASNTDERGTALHLLGNALLGLGERQGGTQRLEAAVAAYRAALEERPRERVPLDWATTQNNLGNALATLGERENSTTRLEAAVAAYRAALEEGTRERVPLQWAMTQVALGTALLSLGEREGGTARLEAAVDAFKAALEVFEPANATHYVEMVRGNLEQATAVLDQRRAL